MSPADNAAQPTERQSTEVPAGSIERVTFHNAGNGFCVLRIKARGHRHLVTVAGTPLRSAPVNGSPSAASG